jgi:hypothetical protein
MRMTTKTPNISRVASGSPEPPDELELRLLKEEWEPEEEPLPPLDEPPPPALANWWSTATASSCFIRKPVSRPAPPLLIDGDDITMV